MRIALFQMNIAWENKEKNYLSLENKLDEISKKKIDLILLPEMSFTGFSMNTDITGEYNGESIRIVSRFARLYNIAIGFGWVKGCGKKSENHYTVIDKSGTVISDYVKMHPFSLSGEEQKFYAGESIAIFEIDGIKMSTFICYDLRFPEIFQIASKKAHIILVLANWPQKRRNHWKCLLQARAIENQVYIIAVNCVGEIGGISYSGDSCIVNPNGEFLIESFNKRDLLEYALVDDVDEFRREFPTKDDRREDLYIQLIKR